MDNLNFFFYILVTLEATIVQRFSETSIAFQKPVTHEVYQLTKKHSSTIKISGFWRLAPLQSLVVLIVKIIVIQVEGITMCCIYKFLLSHFLNVNPIFYCELECLYINQAHKKTKTGIFRHINFNSQFSFFSSCKISTLNFKSLYIQKSCLRKSMCH